MVDKPRGNRCVCRNDVPARLWGEEMTGATATSIFPGGHLPGELPQRDGCLLLEQVMHHLPPSHVVENLEYLIRC